MKREASFALIAAVALGGAAVAEAATRLAPARAVVETVRSDMPISGSTSVGFMARPPAASDFRTIYVQVPAAVEGALCVWLTSVNGRYRAQAEYRLAPAAGSRIVELDFPYRRLSEAGALKPMELAILAHVEGPCDGARPGTALVAGWSPELAGKIGYFVNAGSGARAFQYAGSEDAPCVDAETLGDLSASAFNFVCWVTPKTGRGEVTVQRDRNGSLGQPIRLKTVR